MTDKSYKLFAVVLESGVDTNSKVIQGISQISVEDRARRFFRKAGVPMKQVVKEDTAENEATWTGFAGNAPLNHEEVVAKANELFQGILPQLTAGYAEWQAANRDMELFESTCRPAAEKYVNEAGVKFISFTARPFILMFQIQVTQFTIGRNRSAGFDIKEVLV